MLKVICVESKLKTHLVFVRVTVARETETEDYSQVIM